MPRPEELREKFWDSLKTDMTMMLGLNGADEGHMRPMTAHIEGQQNGPIWFFASKDAELVRDVPKARSATASFVSKGHDLYACVHGTLVLDNDPGVIDRLWNSRIAAWYEGGKNDPNLALLRLDTKHAEIWQDGSSLMAGIKMLFGADPKKNYKENVAKVRLL
jgi:general stress protein 26